MRARVWPSLVGALMFAAPIGAETPIADIEIGAGKTHLFSMQSRSPEILHVTLHAAPPVAIGAKVIAFGQNHGMEANCTGPDCRGVWTLFCPHDGVVKGYVKNFQARAVKATLLRVDCEGKDARTLMCPTDKQLATRACSKFKP